MQTSPLHFEEINDQQWLSIASYFPESSPRQERRGRPSRSTRAVFDGVMWVLINGKPWAAMPAHFPPYKTCHRRFKAWRDSGVLEKVMQTLYGNQLVSIPEHMAYRIRAVHKKPLAQSINAFDALIFEPHWTAPTPVHN